MTQPTEADLLAVSAQLGRRARGVRRVAHRCTCGLPDVVQTDPRLPDGTPFPTTYYLTCPRACSDVGRLEGAGVMAQMSNRLGDDTELTSGYRRAHDAYLAERTALEDVPEIDGISAGGMPDRVKCLHVLVAHALAGGPGVNPLGDEALSMMGDWGSRGPCVCLGPDAVGSGPT